MENMQSSSTPGSNGVIKWVIGIIILAVIIWAVYANNKKTNSQSSSQETIKIGAIQAMTGDAGNVGEVTSKAIKIAVDEINDNGGINGKKIELILEDGKCSGKDAVSAAQKLVNVDKVQFIIGGLCSGETIPAVAVTEAGKVLLASGSATSPKLAGISSYFFRIAPNDNDQGSIMAEIANKRGYKKIALIVEQTDYAKGVYGAFKENFEKLGGNVVSEEYVSGSNDFKTQITKLKSQNPEALYVVANSNTMGGKILNEVKNQNWSVQLFLDEALSTDNQFIMDNKTQLEGAIGIEFKVDENNKKFANLKEKYKTLYGKELSFSGFSAANYDLVYIFKAGVEQVGNNGEKLSSWSRTIKNFEGATGKVSIKPNGDNQSSYSPNLIKDGKLTPYQ